MESITGGSPFSNVLSNKQDVSPALISCFVPSSLPPRAFYAAKAGLELAILLPQPPECWVWRLCSSWCSRSPCTLCGMVACMVLCTWRTCAAVIGRLCAVMGDGGGAQAGAQARGACCQRPFTDQQDGRCNPQHQENNPTKSKKNMTWKALRTPRA
jgi:hypothetical protein